MKVDFSAAGRTYKSNSPARLCLQIKVFDQRSVRRIPERNLINFNRTFYIRK